MIIANQECIINISRKKTFRAAERINKGGRPNNEATNNNVL